MILTPQQMLESLSGRGWTGKGIQSAAGYIATAVGAGGIKNLPALLGMSIEDVEKHVKAGLNKLVFCGTKSHVNALSSKAGNWEVKGTPFSKELGTSVGNAVMSFECVASSKNADRDGDELNPKGAKIDPMLPLLWQHMPFQPIGKMTKLIDQSDEDIKMACAIADTELGRDAAILVEFGALRISQGFNPTKYSQIKTDGDSYYGCSGYKVEEWDMLELSLVSIPANTDAIITANSRQKLHHPLMKSMADRMYDERRNVVPVTPNGSGSTRSEGSVVVKNYLFTGGRRKKSAGDPKPTQPKDAPKPVEKTTPPAKKKEDGESEGGPLLTDLVAQLESLVSDEAVPSEARARL
ncbi:MAG: HK97 family phage prohead protease, partial [Fimbriiglobus sp.]